MATWGGLGKAKSGGLQRELFFFSEEHLFGSMYAADPAPRGTALVLCPSWGHELSESLELCHALGRGLAASGGAGLVVHWPGHGESGGASEETDLNRLAGAAARALREARRRHPGAAWGLAGIRCGVPPVTVAALSEAPSAVLLIRPVLDPSTYFSELRRRGRRARLGGDDGDHWAFGHPVPADDSWDLDVTGALATLSGPIGCVGYKGDPFDPRLSVFHTTQVSARQQPNNARESIVRASLAFLESVEEAARG